MKIATVLASILLASLCHGASLEDLQTSFMARYDEVNAARDSQLKTLETSYLGALDRYLEKTRASGELIKVVPARDEVEAIKTGATPLPELSENTDPELKSMRTKYVEAHDRVRKTHAEALVDLSAKMSVALETQEKDLTRANKIDDALAAKRMRETLAGDAGIASARALLATGAAAKPDSAKPAEWELLLKQNMTVEEKGFSPVGTLSELARNGGGFLSRLLTGDDGNDPDDTLVTPAPCKVSFKPDSDITGIRGEVSLAFGRGSATVRIKVGGKQVFEEKLDGGNTSEKINLEFPADREIVIEVEEAGNDGGDDRGRDRGQDRGFGRGAWVFWKKLEGR